MQAAAVAASVGCTKRTIARVNRSGLTFLGKAVEHRAVVERLEHLHVEVTPKGGAATRDQVVAEDLLIIRGWKDLDALLGAPVS